MSVMFQLTDEVDNGRREKKIEVVRGEESVSCLWAIDLRMRVGRSQVPTCGIGGVRTPEKFRNQGNARLLLEFTNAWMREQGYGMALLFGIENFYHKFGYVAVIPEIEISIPKASLASCRKRHKVRLMRPSDRIACHKLFDRLNSEKSGTLSRQYTADRKYPKGQRGKGPFVALDSKERIIGFMLLMAKEKSLEVHGLQGKDLSVVESLVRVLAPIARTFDQEAVPFFFPSDHLLLQMLPRLGGHLKKGWRKNGGGMVRILDLERTMRAALPTLSQRLKTAGLLESCPSLRLVTDLGDCVLAPGKDGLALDSAAKKGSRIQMSQGVLCRLLMGYETVDAAQDREDVSMPKRTLPFLEALFPVGHPYCWRPDRF